MNEEQYKKSIERKKQSQQKSFERQKNKRFISKEYLRNKALDEISFSNKSGSYINHFRGSPGQETPAHIDTKYEVWKELRKKKHDVIVEAIFKNGSRADILDITGMRVYEILSSETKTMCEKKKDYYPEMFDIVMIDAKNFNKDDII
jgi:hypothetical protein